jgi:hypothetical protein
MHSLHTPLSLLLAVGIAAPMAQAAKLTVTLNNAADVAAVGAFLRWDQDGNHRKKVNPKAKIDVPEIDAKAVQAGANKWVFDKLEPGRYDLVIMGKNRQRIEGWHYPPVQELDPIFPPDAPCDDEARQFIVDDIHKSEYYENKVSVLYLGGDKKTVRVLVQLIRDKPTSYLPGFGTIRYEVWQYDWNYGGWQKNKRTKVLHRIGAQVSEFRQWTWLWEPKLGGIEVKTDPVEIEYSVPERPDPAQLKGLYPY